MDRVLRPERLEINAKSNSAAKLWKYWFATFENFLDQIQAKEDQQKLKILTNFTSSAVYEHISECTTYKEGITALKSHYIKPVNEIYARYHQLTARQNHGESVDLYLQALTVLSRDCQFKPVTADIYRDDFIRVAFISSLITVL